jgi:hypothetical protein
LRLAYVRWEAVNAHVRADAARNAHPRHPRDDEHHGGAASSPSVPNGLLGCTTLTLLAVTALMAIVKRI